MVVLALATGAADPRAAPPPTELAVGALANEVRTKGWIAYTARSAEGDWDLFLCRPDGSYVRSITRTSDYNEHSPQFSRDGRRLLYRRMPRNEKIDNNHHGTQGALVFANSDGTNPQVFGGEGEYTWASCSPDGKQIACLSIKGVSFIDVATKQVVRKLERKGFFQQVTWSPDGRWLCGVANSFGASWSIARMDAETGAANAVNRVDCCTPDWFPDSQNLIFSWRPPGQEVNNGYGWTQLWQADGEGKSRSLVYAEDGRHVYGGHVSPDGKYVLFTGNMQEDGDPGNAGAPMGLMRLADAPILGGDAARLKAEHPRYNTGPVLVLPAGWEPCWTSSESPAGVQQQRPAAAVAVPAEADDLANEVRGAGWVAFSAKTEAGDWDLYLCRPDGSDRRPLTATRDFHEAGVRFSPGGEQILYYRMPRSEPLDNNTYGTFELMRADADGSHVESLGSHCCWATWGPDGSQIACLTGGTIRIVNLTTRKTVRDLPRKGIVQQLGWSPDGKWFAGTANGLGPYWNIGRMNAETDAENAVSETDRYNCTPDWSPDSRYIVYSRGIIPEQGGFAEIWMAKGDGRERRAVCVEANRHLYGACISPDGRYLLFTRSEADLGPVEPSRTSMSIIRLADAPVVAGESSVLRSRFPAAHRGPRLDLSWGWEPHWTSHDVRSAPARGKESTR
jgi:Tol biopolymer transport system component